MKYLRNSETRPNHSLFIWEPPGAHAWLAMGEPRSGKFDDLLLWMTREELALALSGEIPPLPQMAIPAFP